MESEVAHAASPSRVLERGASCVLGRGTPSLVGDTNDRAFGDVDDGMGLKLGARSFSEKCISASRGASRQRRPTQEVVP